MMLRPLLLCMGWLALLAGLLGVVLPLLPTTPFVLLAAGCFSRSSQRCHRWLASAPVLGGMLADYADQRGISVRNRRVALSVLWFGIGTSCVLLRPSIVLPVLLLAIGLAVSALLFSLRIASPPAPPATQPPTLAKLRTCTCAIAPVDRRRPWADRPCGSHPVTRHRRARA